MAINVNDCPPHLRDAILKQLAKEDAAKPPAPVVTYHMATLLNGNWSLGPPSKDFKLVKKLVNRYNTFTAANAYQTSIGNPLAKLIEVTTPATLPV